MKIARNRQFRSVMCGVLISFSMAIPSMARADSTGASLLSWAEYLSALSRAALPTLTPHTYNTKKPSTQTCIAVDSVRATNELFAFVNHHSEAWTSWLYNGGWLVYDVTMLTQHINALAEHGDKEFVSIDDVALSQEAAGFLQEAIDWLSWGLPWVEYWASAIIADSLAHKDTTYWTTTYRVRLQSILSLSRMLQVWIEQRHTPTEQLCGVLVAAHLILTVSEFFRDYNQSPSTGGNVALPSAVAPAELRRDAASKPIGAETGPQSTMPTSTVAATAISVPGAATATTQANTAATPVVVLPTQPVPPVTTTTAAGASASVAAASAAANTGSTPVATNALAATEPAPVVGRSIMASPDQRATAGPVAPALKPIRRTIGFNALHAVARIEDPLLPSTPPPPATSALASTSGQNEPFRLPESTAHEYPVAVGDDQSVVPVNPSTSLVTQPPASTGDGQSSLLAEVNSRDLSMVADVDEKTLETVLLLSQTTAAAVSDAKSPSVAVGDEEKVELQLPKTQSERLERLLKDYTSDLREIEESLLVARANLILKNNGKEKYMSMQEEEAKKLAHDMRRKRVEVEEKIALAKIEWASISNEGTLSLQPEAAPKKNAEHDKKIAELEAVVRVDIGDAGVGERQQRARKVLDDRRRPEDAWSDTMRIDFSQQQAEPQFGAITPASSSSSASSGSSSAASSMPPTAATHS